MKRESFVVQLASHSCNNKKNSYKSTLKKFQIKRKRGDNFGQHSRKKFSQNFGERSSKSKYKYNGKCKFCDIFGTSKWIVGDSKIGMRKERYLTSSSVLLIKLC